MDTTSYEFRVKYIALLLACLLHICILVLLSIYTHSHKIITQSTRRTPLRVSLTQPLNLPAPALPAPLVEPEPTTAEPTQSITNSVAHTAPELPHFIPQIIQQDITPDTIVDTASFDHHTIDNHDHAAEQIVSAIPDTTQNIQDTEATHEITQALPVSTPTHTTDTTSTQHQHIPSNTPTRQPRRKKRYVNKRFLAATQTPETQELMQACKTALKSVVQNTDMRINTPDYKKLAQQAAQADISVEHMAQVQDQLTHMKYAHYENKARELLRQTCNIHTINVTIAKPILEYIDIFITVDKQGNVLQVKFCTPLLFTVEQAITKLIKLCQFPPLPDHFKSPEHTFGLRALVDFQQGEGHLTCR